ncbi:hypothetical protein HYW75_06600 [Candidatus Pacearchaeota archaeon]|nr:hypothetical protein [Candidatus Pacearchaeota archaeon]
MFHNIFSKKKEKKEKIIGEKIIIDNREKNSLVPAKLSSLNLKIEFQHLSVGDYLINNIAIERKTISDLKASIINKRIFSQIQEMKQYPSNFLLIEGDINEIFNNEIIHENALRGFIIASILDYKIPIIFSRNEKDTSLYLSLLAKKRNNEEVSIRPSKILFSKEEQLQFILEGFPYIGPVKAKSLLKKFKSLKKIISASESDLQEILGKRTKDFEKLLE